MDNEELTCGCGCQTWRITDTYTMCSDCGWVVPAMDVSAKNRRMEEDYEDSGGVV